MPLLQVAFICFWYLKGLPMFFYFFTLGLHTILIGLHLLFGWGSSERVLLVKIWSKWIHENPKRRKVLIFVSEGVVFAFIELSFLVSASQHLKVSLLNIPVCSLARLASNRMVESMWQAMGCELLAQSSPSFWLSRGPSFSFGLSLASPSPFLLKEMLRSLPTCSDRSQGK